MQIFGSKKSIEEIAGAVKHDAKKLRNENPVLVIDDQPFSRTDSLVRNGFRVTEVRDLHPMSTVAEFSLICCDIDGVGKLLGFQDGAELMKEIKKCYPMKPVISFSNKENSMLRLRKLKVVDEWFDKDVSLDEWIERLDAQFEQLADPYKQWKKCRAKLLDNGISIHVVADLESEFVEAFRTDQLKHFEGSKIVSKLNAEVKPIVQGLISNVIFLALTR